MTVFANGMSGYIGQALWSVLEKNFSAKRVASSRQKDALYYNLLETSAEDIKWLNSGDIFVFLAAWSKPDQCRADPDGAWQVNVTHTARLIDMILKKKATVLFFSSDTVYGRQDGPLTENAPLLATEAYGQMKAEIEKSFAQVQGFTSLRLSYVVSMKDAVSGYLFSCAQKGLTAEVFGEYQRNMVWIDDVVAAVCALTKLAAQGATLPKALNIGGPACISRLQMAQAFKNSLDKRLNFSDTVAPEGFFQSRPRRVELDVSQLTSILGRPPLSLEEAYHNI